AAGERDLDARSDVYSLACVLFEMLGGEPPFAAASARVVMTRHITQEPRSIRELRPEVGDGVAAAIARALAKDPEHRWSAVPAFLSALHGVAARPGASAPHGTRSIAVLPFVNLSPDRQNEYLSDGITDELIGALARV